MGIKKKGVGVKKGILLGLLREKTFFPFSCT